MIAYKIGDSVVANPDDANEFIGTIVDIRLMALQTLYTVKDQDDDCFDCAYHQIEHVHN